MNPTLKLAVLNVIKESMDRKFLKESLEFLKEIDTEDIPRRFTNKGGYSVSEHPRPEDFQVGKHYQDGDVLNYVLGQHAEFEDEDDGDGGRINGTYQCLEVDPKSLPESTFHVERDKVKQLARSKREYPPIVLDMFGYIVDGGHRLAAAVVRGDKKIKVLRQVKV